jgi:hypothetical protein
MAMHRRVTLPNLGGGPAFAHNRAHNSLDQDRQDFERNQVILNKLFRKASVFYIVDQGWATIFVRGPH